MVRALVIAALGLAALLLGGAVAAILLIGQFDLSSPAAGRASAALGRKVTIGALHVVPGRWITIDVEGGRLANIAGGSNPAMAELRHLTAQIEAISLLRGPLMIRGLTVEGLSVLLQRTPAHTPNWRFGAPKPLSPPKRTAFPILLDARMRDSALIYRTERGAEFRIQANEATMRTAAADQPVRLTLGGAYNGTPVSLEADMQPIAVLRNAALPYGVDLHLRSDQTALNFKGTLTEPLDADGASGVATLLAPTPKALLAFMGMSGTSDLSLQLTGTAARQGDVWRLADARGALQGSAITAMSLRFTEGGRGKPDALAAEIAFDRLDLNKLLAGGGKSGPDIPLDIVRAPDPLIDARLSARQLMYRGVMGSDASLAANARPGQIAVNALSFTYLGAQIRAQGRIEPADQGGRVSGDVAVVDADVQQLRQLLGLAQLPLTGKLDGQLVVRSSGATLNAAARVADIEAAVSMHGGRVAREVIEMASTDIRTLFRTARGTSQIACLLGVVTMRAGIGTVSPLRIRAADGTIVGEARFDLYRRVFDLTIGSQPASTGIFALDIPVRVSGSFAHPSVRPAQWSASGRAMLAREAAASRIPPGLQQIVQRNPCLHPAPPAGGH